MDENMARREIEAMFEAAVESWNRHDLKAYVSLWTEGADFVNVVGMHREGRSELLAEVEYLHASRFRNSQITPLRSKIRFLTPEVAVAHFWWQMTGDPGMPGIPGPADGLRRGIFTHVVSLTPDGWRFTASQNTDVLPIPDPLRQGSPRI